MDLKNCIRDIPDFPKEGIIFKDITTLLQNPEALKQSVDELCDPFRDQNIEAVAGIESRGFIFGAPMAIQLGVGFIPVRKPGKLPAETVKEEYSLEYGTDAVEIHKDALSAGQKVLIVDDLLATGGTAQASIRLVEKCGATVAGVAFVIELDFLKGREKLVSVPVHTLIHY